MVNCLMIEFSITILHFRNKLIKSPMWLCLIRVAAIMGEDRRKGRLN